MTPVPNAAKYLPFVWHSIPKPARYLGPTNGGHPRWGLQSPDFFVWGSGTSM